MSLPLVSVLITVYNDKEHILTSVESILNQRYTNFEIIIVDDGSTDGTSDILRNLVSREERVKVLSKENGGTASAANLGLSMCNGKYIARLDSDDYSYDHRLSTQVEFLEKHPDVDLVGGGCHIIDKDGKIIGSRNIFTSNPKKTLQNRCIYQQSDVMFRKSVLGKLAPGEVYRTKLRAEDYDLWLRISEVGNVAKINTILGAWRLNTGGYTLSRKEEQLEAVNVLKKMADLRRRGLPDEYELFQPLVSTKKHRAIIPQVEYDIVVSQVLLKEGRTEEAKKILLPHKKSSSDWNLAKKWYRIASIPGPILKLLFSVREWILNHSSIELR